MMESNFQRRAIGRARLVGSSNTILSPKGTMKKKKQDVKAKERRALDISNLNILIGRLEDRDTQQQAFTALIESLQGLDPSLVKEMFLLIEKNKRPCRTSTGRMLVLLTAALCKCHPMQSAKLLPRILSYICLRLRDKQSKTTDACVILVSAIALYIFPCPVISLPDATSPYIQNEESSPQLPFQAVAAVFTRESHAVGAAATRCVCSLLYPVDFDGVSVPGPNFLRAHATRIRPFFKLFLADIIAKMDGSTKFATFSSLFLLLQSACLLARDAYEKVSISQLGDDFAPYISSIYEAIEDAVQRGPRNDWMLRKRGMELLTLLLEVFVLQEAAWCCTVKAAKEYFLALLERLRALLLTGRHDSISLVREAASTAAMAFECVEKLCPQAGDESRHSLSGGNDFVSPKPHNDAYISKRWPKLVASIANDSHDITAEDSNPDLPLLPLEELEDLKFNDQEAGDEALASYGNISDDDAPGSNKESKLVGHHSGNNTTLLPISNIETAIESESKILEPTEDEDRLDHAGTPESGDDKLSLAQKNWRNGQQDKVNSMLSTERTSKPYQPVLSQKGAQRAVAPLKDFKAKQRAHFRSQSTQLQNTVQIALPKNRLSQNQIGFSQHSNIIIGGDTFDQDDDSTANTYKLTRAETALKAARSGDYELALRLCIVEDDLALLRQMLTMIKTPCMEILSLMVRNALCAAFLSLLDGDDDDESPDVWLALKWLQHWATTDGRQIKQLDPRIVEALSSSLDKMAMASTATSLTAAHVIFLLGL